MIENNQFYLTLIRHAQSEVNATPDFVGQSADVPLSYLGKMQAKSLNKRLLNERFDKVYSSPYLRALDTAKLSLEYNERDITIVNELREYSAGDWIGSSRKKTFTPQIISKMDKLNHDFLPPNGESFNQVQRRVSEWLETELLYNKEKIELCDALKKTELPPQNYVCYSHGITIKCLLQHILGFDKTFTWKIDIENTSITRLYFGKDGWRLLCLNDYAHLNTSWASIWPPLRG